MQRRRLSLLHDAILLSYTLVDEAGIDILVALVVKHAVVLGKFHGRLLSKHPIVFNSKGDYVLRNLAI